MSLMPDFGVRSSAPELMDEPGCDSGRLTRTLAQFRFINALFGRTGTLGRMIAAAVQSSGKPSPLICDIGCGGGDTIRSLSRLFRSRGVPARFLGIDPDTRCIDFCSAAAADPALSFRRDALFALDERGETFDWCWMSNVLHHFEDADIGPALAALDRISSRGFIIADLPRSPLAWLGFGAFAAMFLHGSFARVDGLRSITRGFTVAEFEQLAARLRAAGRQVRVGTLFPGRIFLFCRKDD